MCSRDDVLGVVDTLHQDGLVGPLHLAAIAELAELPRAPASDATALEDGTCVAWVVDAAAKAAVELTAFLTAGDRDRRVGKLDGVVVAAKQPEAAPAGASARSSGSVAAQRSDTRLVRRGAPPFARLGLLLLKHARAPDLLRRMRRWQGLLRRVWLEKGPEAFERIARYTLTVADVPLSELGDLVERAAEPRAREIVMTTAERLRREGRKEGREEGHKEARSDVLLRQLTTRFGTMDADIVERIRTASAAQLDQWLDRILVAASIDEVLAD
jgi:hypothetical protein